MIYHAAPVIEMIVRWAMFLVFVALIGLYAKKIKAVYDEDKENFENLTGEPAFYPPWRLP
jgi:hypothetical protein